MLCYRDMTFCSERTCANFGPCPRSLTEEVEARAKASGLWVAQFVERPGCYEDQRKPPPPGDLVDALQDTVHREVGKWRVAKVIKKVRRA